MKRRSLAAKLVAAIAAERSGAKECIPLDLTCDGCSLVWYVGPPGAGRGG